MMKNGMFVVVANSIEELEADVASMKLAIAQGGTIGSGSVAEAMLMDGVTTDDVINAVSDLIIGTPPTADDCECCGCCCEDDYAEDLDEVLDHYSDSDIKYWVGANFTPAEIYDYEEMLNNIPLNDILAFVKDNL